MKIIIIGAGELGQLVAMKLCSLKHDVVIVDTRPESLEHASEVLDTRVLIGAGTDVEILKEAGASNADLLLALSGDEAVNILACTMVKTLGTAKTICRVSTSKVFSEENGLTPSYFHIDQAFSPVEEGVARIYDVLQNRILRHQITLQNPDALLDVVGIPLNSVLSGMAIKDLPCVDLLKTVRLAAIIRKRELVIPHGDTVLQPGDNLYVAGRSEDVKAFVEWLSRDGSTPLRRVIVAGVSPISEGLVQRLLEDGLDVRVIEPDYKKADQFLSKFKVNLKVIQGEATNTDVLVETGVGDCDAFIALSSREGNNILACLKAARNGAKKVIAVTNSAEYMDFMPAMEQSGCWFNITQIAANAAFRLMAHGMILVDPELRAIDARLVEVELGEKSKLVGKSLQDCHLPEKFLIALILRGDEVIAPTGQTVLASGDHLVTFASALNAQKIQEFV